MIRVTFLICADTIIKKIGKIRGIQSQLNLISHVEERKKVIELLKKSQSMWVTRLVVLSFYHVIQQPLLLQNLLHKPHPTTEHP